MTASEILVLSAGAPKAGLNPCAQRFTELSGVPVRFRFETAPVLRQSLEAEMRGGHDTSGARMLVGPRSLCEQLEIAGFLPRGRRVRIGGIQTAMFVHKNAAIPDVSSVAALRAALCASPGVVFNRASSGLYIEKVLEKLGLSGQECPPDGGDSWIVRTDTGAQVIEYVAEQAVPGVIGFGQMTEVRRLASRGIVPAGALPAELANTTVYDACTLPFGVGNESATALLNFLASDEARALFLSVGIE